MFNLYVLFTQHKVYRYCVMVHAGMHISVGCRDQIPTAYYKRQTDSPRITCNDGNDI